MRPRLLNIVHGIDAAIEKLSAYFTKTRKTRIYALALCLSWSSFLIVITTTYYFVSVINLTITLKWLEANWTADEAEAVKGWMLEAVSTTSSFMFILLALMMMPQMLEYQSSRRRCSTTQTQTLQDPPATTGRHASSASHAAHAQLSGFARIKTIEWSLSNPIIVLALSTISRTSGQQDHEMTLEDMAAADRVVVEEHWKKYIDEGVIDDPEILENFDLLYYWQVRMILSNSMVSIQLSICS